MSTSAPRFTFSKMGPSLTSTLGIGVMPSDTRFCHARTRSSGDIFGSRPSVRARRGNQPSPFESTRKPFWYPGISSNRSAGFPWPRPASSVAIPISSSARAPRTTRSSPRSSIRFSQSRRSRKVLVGRSATAIVNLPPPPVTGREGQLAKWLYHWPPRGGPRSLEQTAVERAFHEGIVDDLRGIDGLHLVVELRDDVLDRRELRGRRGRWILEDRADVPVVRGLHALVVVGLEVLLQRGDRVRPIGAGLRDRLDDGVDVALDDGPVRADEATRHDDRRRGGGQVEIGHLRQGMEAGGLQLQ